jgi:tetratricopeptide (TPR) repeat protein
MSLHKFRSRLLLPAAVVAAGALAGCDSMNRLMEVDNPGQIGEVALNDPELIPAMVASTVGQFQAAYDQLTRAGALLADEAVNGHNFSQWRDIDLRIIESSNSIMASDIYNPIQRARGAADDYAGRIREIRGEAAASRDLGLARVLAYGGYSYVMLGEFFCASPVRPDQGALTSQEILEQAIARFDEAIQIAQAFRAATPTQAARADSIINLARVGAARAHLWNGNRAQAIQHASQVPANYEAWVAYSQDTQYRNNIFQAATTGANRSVGVAASFRNLNDPRVRHTATSGRGHNGLTLLWDPFIGVSHSGYSAATATRFLLGTGIRFASGLEARYIVAEAEGLNAANLAFVNSRRAVGNQAPLAGLTEAQYMAELRDQRRRDFFMSGHRLGDLRRYQRLYNLDLFPSGPHPNTEWGNYDSATCFVPSTAERVGNPNYRP